MHVLVIFQIQILIEVNIKIKTFLLNEEIYGAKIWNWPWYTYNSILHPIFFNILRIETEVHIQIHKYFYIYEE